MIEVDAVARERIACTRKRANVQALRESFRALRRQRARLS